MIDEKLRLIRDKLLVTGGKWQNLLETEPLPPIGHYVLIAKYRPNPGQRFRTLACRWPTKDEWPACFMEEDTGLIITSADSYADVLTPEDQKLCKQWQMMLKPDGKPNLPPFDKKVIVRTRDGAVADGTTVCFATLTKRGDNIVWYADSTCVIRLNVELWAYIPGEETTVAEPPILSEDRQMQIEQWAAKTCRDIYTNEPAFTRKHYRFESSMGQLTIGEAIEQVLLKKAISCQQHSSPLDSGVWQVLQLKDTYDNAMPDDLLTALVCKKAEELGVYYPGQVIGFESAEQLAHLANEAVQAINKEESIPVHLVERPVGWIEASNLAPPMRTPVLVATQEGIYTARLVCDPVYTWVVWPTGEALGEEEEFGVVTHWRHLPEKPRG